MCVTVLIITCQHVKTHLKLMHVIDTDCRPKGAVVETSRCLVFLTLCRFGHLKPLVPSLSFVFEVRHLL